MWRLVQLILISMILLAPGIVKGAVEGKHNAPATIYYTTNGADPVISTAGRTEAVTLADDQPTGKKKPKAEKWQRGRMQKGIRR